jgi:hypothetical protein
MFGSHASKRSRSARRGWAKHKARTMVSEGIPALFQPKRQAANARKRSQRRRGSGLL